jgi:hypothetical protein
MLVDAPAWMRSASDVTDDFEWLEAEGASGEPSHELALLQRVYA